MNKVDIARIGIGDVDITIDGEIKRLKTSFRAAQSLSRQYGGFSDIVSRLVKMDLDVIESVMAAGLHLTDAGRVGLDEKIYRNKPASFISPCIKYISNLANGGQPLEDSTALTEADEENDPNVVNS